ncbi:S8 family serine peptidase [uncultured Sphingomonas sp.]|uniref:S8 family serine peptidase n=1 Tax=uncultured Sphingomonas sp. TaxID=158754 RepID=UPI0025E8DAB5|nr:S8 family serine peptidase [uncultured Sphingomonas sp.]
MISAGLLLAACGGGGGVNSGGSTAPPTATPAPTPAPSPTPTSAADSAEYKASGAVVIARAAYAYDRSITGKGVTIAVLDTGINRSTPEFAGRISADSTGFEQRIARCGTCAAETLAPYAIDDKQGHGTTVASVALAARNDVGPQGVAPEATLLALKIVGADLSGQTAGSTGPIPESSSANAMLIAPAIRYAVEKGAFVSVLSLNGFGTGQIAQDQRAAMDQVRLANRLLVNSVDNATGQDSFTGQFAENFVGTDRANKDWFLFAIGVDQNGNPRSANGNAGPLADRMLAAGGNNVQVVDKDGNVVSVTGNSFAAPAVAGAAALLKQYWPQLGGKAISRILLDTATDAGAPGVDAVFGAGILNVEKAMQAQAPASSFAAADAVLTRFSSLTTSAPFGGAAATLTGQVGGMTVFDRYGRDFAMAGSTGVRTRGSGLLAGTMLAPTDVPWRAAQAETARFGFANNVGAYSGTRPALPAVVSFAPAAGQQVTIGTNVAIGGGSGLAGSPLRGIASMPVGSMSAWSGGGWSASFSSGTSRDGRLRQQVIGFAMPLGFGLELSDLAERGQVLGMRGDATLGLAGARTTLATLIYRQTLAGIDLTAKATASSTRASGGSDLLRFGGRLVGSSFAVEGARGVFGGRATLGLSSPLRVERARAMLLTPVSFDLVSGALATRTVAVDLAPDARELDLELGWATALSPTSSLRFGVARAFDAGHVAGAFDTAGFVTIAIR